MSQLPPIPAGVILAGVLIALSFLAVVGKLALDWSRRHRARVEYAQRSVEAVTWPGSTAAPHSPTTGTTFATPVRPRTARSELRSGPR